MVQRVVRVAPLQAGKVFALMYGAFSLVFFGFLMLPALLGVGGGPPIWFAVLFIPLYVIGGFVATSSMAWLYNIIASWVGGIELTIEVDDEVQRGRS